jgi:hypothetical protein
LFHPNCNRPTRRPDIHAVHERVVAWQAFLKGQVADLAPDAAELKKAESKAAGKDGKKEAKKKVVKKAAPKAPSQTEVHYVDCYACCVATSHQCYWWYLNRVAHGYARLVNIITLCPVINVLYAMSIDHNQ